MSAATTLSLWLDCLIAMAVFGGALFRLCLPDRPEVAAIDPLLRRIFRILAMSSLAAAILHGAVEAAAIGGDWAAIADPDMLRSVFLDTGFGRAWLWHIGAAFLLYAAANRRRPFGASAWAAAALLVTQARTGHPAMAGGFSGLYWQANHALHLLAGGAWLGGMIPLVLLARRPTCPLELYHRFTPYGVGAVCLVVLSGAYNAGQLAEASEALFTSPYGRAFLIKLGLVTLMGGCGLVNRLLFLVPAGHRGTACSAALPIGLMLELAIGALTVGAACWLGSLPPMTAGG